VGWQKIEGRRDTVRDEGRKGRKIAKNSEENMW
jgi:hypothetical protein